MAQQAEAQRRAQEAVSYAQGPQYSESELSAIRALGNGSKDQFEQFSPHEQRKAAEYWRDANERALVYDLQPERFYQDRLVGLVESHIQHHLQGVRDWVQQRQADEVLKKNDDKLTSDADWQRAYEILQTIPEGGPTERRVELAVNEFLRERRNSEIASKEQKLKTKERQLKANKRQRRSKGRARGTRKGKPKQPVLESPEEVLGHYNELLARELNKGS